MSNNNKMYQICRHIPIRDSKMCPCSVCLVKAMCKKRCDEFKVFFRLRYKTVYKAK